MELVGVALFVDDVPALAAFYRTLFDADPSSSDESVAVFHVGRVEVLLHETDESEPGGLPAEDHFAFAVDDVDERFAELVDAGREPFREPADYDWGRSAYFRAPDGQLVELTG